MDSRKLNKVLDLLIRETVQHIDRDDPTDRKSPSLVKAAPLLVQLRQACKPGMEQGSGGGGGGSPAPLALNAWDLYRKIDETATYMYWTNKGDQPLSSFKLAARIHYWATRSLVSQEKIDEATKILAGWVSDIEQLFNPGKTIPIPGKCPDCGKETYTATEDGETIRKPALTAHPGTYGTYATCGNCNQRWAGPELNELKLRQMIQEQKERESSDSLRVEHANT